MDSVQRTAGRSFQGISHTLVLVDAQDPECLVYPGNTVRLTAMLQPPRFSTRLLLLRAAEICVVGPKYLGLVTASLEETRNIPS